MIQRIFPGPAHSFIHSSTRSINIPWDYCTKLTLSVEERRWKNEVFCIHRAGTTSGPSYDDQNCLETFSMSPGKGQVMISSPSDNC